MVARIITPPVIKALQPFEVRLVIQHPMETGFRQDVMGNVIAKNVIKQVTVTFNSQTVFKANLGTGTAANPSLQFWMKAATPGLIKLQWEDDVGVTGETQKHIDVE
jgi:sulfur-oxidizing protein SoxZ